MGVCLHTILWALATERRGGAQVWVTAELDSRGRVRLGADSDSELTRGLAAVLVRCLSGLAPSEVLQVALLVWLAPMPSKGC